MSVKYSWLECNVILLTCTFLDITYVSPLWTVLRLYFKYVSCNTSRGCDEGKHYEKYVKKRKQNQNDKKNISSGMSRTVRDIAKEKISRLFSLVKPAFLLNFIFKIPPSLFFSRAI